MKTLLLLRHAKSDWDAPHESDHDRPLNERGVRSARLVGRRLADAGQAPDLVVSSTAVRARTTAELARLEGGWHAPLRLERSLYDGGPEGVLAVVASAPDVDRLMLVGHQPTWSIVVERLTGESLDMKTACVATVEFDIEDWSEAMTARGRVVGFLNPRDDVEATPESLGIPPGEWSVIGISDGVNLVSPVEDSSLSLTREGMRVAGSSGVNRFMGQITGSGFGPLATTMMAGPQVLMDQERRFLELLECVDRAIVEGNELRLLHGDKVVITLVGASPSGAD